MRIGQQKGDNAQVWHIAVKDKSFKSFKDGDFKPRCGQDGAKYTEDETEEVRPPKINRLHKSGDLCERCADLIDMNNLA